MQNRKEELLSRLRNTLAIAGIEHLMSRETSQTFEASAATNSTSTSGQSRTELNKQSSRGEKQDGSSKDSSDLPSSSSMSESRAALLGSDNRSVQQGSRNYSSSSQDFLAGDSNRVSQSSADAVVRHLTSQQDSEYKRTFKGLDNLEDEDEFLYGGSSGSNTAPKTVKSHDQESYDAGSHQSLPTDTNMRPLDSRIKFCGGDGMRQHSVGTSQVSSVQRNEGSQLPLGISALFKQGGGGMPVEELSQQLPNQMGRSSRLLQQQQTRVATTPVEPSGKVLDWNRLSGGLKLSQFSAGILQDVMKLCAKQSAVIERPPLTATAMSEGAIRHRAADVQERDDSNRRWPNSSLSSWGSDSQSTSRSSSMQQPDWNRQPSRPQLGIMSYDMGRDPRLVPTKHVDSCSTDDINSSDHLDTSRNISSPMSDFPGELPSIGTPVKRDLPQPTATQTIIPTERQCIKNLSVTVDKIMQTIGFDPALAKLMQDRIVKREEEDGAGSKRKKQQQEAEDAARLEQEKLERIKQEQLKEEEERIKRELQVKKAQDEREKAESEAYVDTVSRKILENLEKLRQKQEERVLEARLKEVKAAAAMKSPEMEDFDEEDAFADFKEDDDMDISDSDFAMPIMAESSDQNAAAKSDTKAHQLVLKSGVLYKPHGMVVVESVPCGLLPAVPVVLPAGAVVVPGSLDVASAPRDIPLSFRHDQPAQAPEPRGRVIKDLEWERSTEEFLRRLQQGSTPSSVSTGEGSREHTSRDGNSAERRTSPSPDQRSRDGQRGRESTSKDRDRTSTEQSSREKIPQETTPRRGSTDRQSLDCGKRSRSRESKKLSRDGDMTPAAVTGSVWQKSSGADSERTRKTSPNRPDEKVLSEKNSGIKIASEIELLRSNRDEMWSNIGLLQKGMENLSRAKIGLMRRPASTERDKMMEENTRMQVELGDHLWAVKMAHKELVEKLESLTLKKTRTSGNSSPELQQKTEPMDAATMKGLAGTTTPVSTTMKGDKSGPSVKESPKAATEGLVLPKSTLASTDVSTKTASKAVDTKKASKLEDNKSEPRHRSRSSSHGSSRCHSRSQSKQSSSRKQVSSSSRKRNSSHRRSSSQKRSGSRKRSSSRKRSRSRGRSNSRRRNKSTSRKRDSSSRDRRRRHSKSDSRSRRSSRDRKRGKGDDRHRDSDSRGRYEVKNKKNDDRSRERDTDSHSQKKDKKSRSRGRDNSSSDRSKDRSPKKGLQVKSNLEQSKPLGKISPPPAVIKASPVIIPTEVQQSIDAKPSQNCNLSEVKKVAVIQDNIFRGKTPAQGQISLAATQVSLAQTQVSVMQDHTWSAKSHEPLTRGVGSTEDVENKIMPSSIPLPQSLGPLIKTDIRSTMEGRHLKEAFEMAISLYLRAEEFYDGGNLWCRKCNCVFTDMASLCRHLHSDQHQIKLDPDYSKPRSTTAHKPPVFSVDKPSAPARGNEFIMPLQSFLCTLCCYFAKNGDSMEAHLTSLDHNSKFKEFLHENPAYEMQYLKDKMTSIINLNSSAILPAAAVLPETMTVKEEHQRPSENANKINVSQYAAQEQKAMVRIAPDKNRTDQDKLAAGSSAENDEVKRIKFSVGSSNSAIGLKKTIEGGGGVREPERENIQIKVISGQLTKVVSVKPSDSLPVAADKSGIRSTADIAEKSTPPPAQTSKKRGPCDYSDSSSDSSPERKRRGSVDATASRSSKTNADSRAKFNSSPSSNQTKTNNRGNSPIRNRSQWNDSPARRRSNWDDSPVHNRTKRDDSPKRSKFESSPKFDLAKYDASYGRYKRGAVIDVRDNRKKYKSEWDGKPARGRHVAALGSKYDYSPRRNRHDDSPVRKRSSSRDSLIRDKSEKDPLDKSVSVSKDVAGKNRGGLEKENPSSGKGQSPLFDVQPPPPSKWEKPASPPVNKESRWDAPAGEEAKEETCAPARPGITFPILNTKLRTPGTTTTNRFGALTPRTMGFTPRAVRPAISAASSQQNSSLRKP